MCNGAPRRAALCSAREAAQGALVVGEPTFGKSEVQVTQRTTDGGAVKVTIAGYLTPKGTDIGKKGVQPDVQAVDRPGTSADEALDVALAHACTGKR